jgi:hypothetical protein
MKKTNITLSIALAAVFSSSVAFAEAEVTGKIVHESAVFSDRGNTIGSWAVSTETGDIQHGKGALMKSETSARIYIDGELDEVNEGATYHVEINGFNDSKGVGKYDGNESYTQRDALREAYIDADVEGISIRAGKQQVVWGTADGMKLLDAINPTDYSEMAQNQMEDSRIPVWMINAEGDAPASMGGGFQVILSEGKSSHMAGLGRASAIGTSHSNGSQGHAFIMKGVDTITGKVNGFLNVAPALGSVATVFDRISYAFGNTGLKDQTSTSVNDFATGQLDGGDTFGTICDNNLSTAACLANTANRTGDLEDSAWGTGAGNQNAQNLLKSQTDAAYTAGVANATETFHYLSQTTFATFDSFVDMKSEYRVDHDNTPTLATRYKNSTADGLNYSLNVLHGNDTNPYIEMKWENASTGALLTEKKTTDGSYVTSVLDSSGDTTADVGGTQTETAGTSSEAEKASLVMTEKLNKITQLGGSFDTAIETVAFGPVVLRGEALYQKGVMSPVVTRKDSTKIDLEHGFLVSSIKMEKGDRFKYVLGADITALTNMMVSVQFIQDRNLDYYNTGNKDATNWKYTADMATMSLTNNLNKAEGNKEFYSLFLSKPFGASGEHRWNNMFMFEENGGKWNRLDAEFSIDDDTQATVEVNSYFGDENTQFGQLSKSSNIQVGVKYSF